MTVRFRQHFRSQFVGYIALVIAIGGGTAYAANTIGSSDIIDESILSRDVKNGQVGTSDLAANAVRTAQVLDESLTGHDIQDDTIGGADVNETLLDPLTSPQIKNESLTGHDIQDDTIGGADVNESLLERVPQAGNANTLGGKSASDLGSARLDWSRVGLGNRTFDILPGLHWKGTCAYRFEGGNMGLLWVTLQSDVGGVWSMMDVGYGVDASSEPGTFKITNGASAQGGLLQHSEFSGREEVTIELANRGGSAAGEAQVILRTADRTYAIALHMFHAMDAGNVSGEYCEVFGTVTVAG